MDGTPSVFAQLCQKWSSIDFSLYASELVGYSCGGLFAVGWWLFIDAAVISNAHGLKAPFKFEDWIPGLLSSFALIMINLVDKNLINGNDYMYGGQNVAWKARLLAFIGIALAVGSLGGSITIMCMKYINPGLTGEDAWPGVAIVLQNFLIFISAMVLWLGRNFENTPEYNITL